jgi:hypothetical protein
MHDGNHVHAILGGAIDDSIREAQDSALSYFALNTTIELTFRLNFQRLKHFH